MAQTASIPRRQFGKSGVQISALGLGMAPLGTKPLSGGGPAVKGGVLSAKESLRYAMNLPVRTTTSSGTLRAIQNHLDVRR